MASKCFSFLFSFAVLLLQIGFWEKVEANGFEELPAANSLSSIITLSSMEAENFCSKTAKGANTVDNLLEITHKYGPCSLLKEGNTTIPDLRQILDEDQVRVQYLNDKIFNDQATTFQDSSVSLPASSGQSLGTGNYVVNIGLGTPKQQFTVVFDTGSDLTWVQCKPCAIKCYRQKDPVFNPSASSTYYNVRCGSNACKQLQSATGNSQTCRKSCIYGIGYGDGSYSVGYYATDKLTLSRFDVFSKFRFGCGENNNGLFGTADGLLGLGRNKVSTVSQTASKYGKTFSYCLPSSTRSTGYLAFGRQRASRIKINYTPLLTDSRGPSFYFLSMTGISVGGTRLAISASVFRTSGTVIDSGTVITRLAPTAYSALRAAFRRAMSKYPAASAYSILDTCYNLSRYTKVAVPNIVLHFAGGTDLNVHSSGILVRATSTQYCLAFAGNSAATSLGILGNMQQHTFEVVYNVAGGMLGFGAGGCR